MRMHTAPASAAPMGLFTLALPAMAQEAMFTQAATMPSPGGTIVREQFMWYKYGSNPESGADRIDKLEGELKSLREAIDGLKNALKSVKEHD